MSETPQSEKTLVTRQELIARINAMGVPLSKSQFNKLAMPSCGLGPPVDCYYGTRPLYDLERGLAWARDDLLKKKPKALNGGMAICCGPRCEGKQ